MSDQVLTVLKFCLLGLLYLFFVRVLWAVWTEVRAPSPAPAPTASAGSPSRRRRDRKVRRLVVVAPPATAGTRYDLGAELTLGRASGCQIRVDDSYASQLHARVFQRDGTVYVDDLGSTNGTFVNDQRVSAPRPLKRGDHIRVGSTVLELA